jgi:hypothetical protein
VALTTDRAERLPPSDRVELEQALRALQMSRGLVVRAADLLANTLSSAAAIGLRRLRPSQGLARRVQGVAEVALRRAFETAVLGLSTTHSYGSPGRARAMAMASGAMGGFAGMAGFLPDATFTTLLIMRNIAIIAQDQGEDLSTEDARRACLQVFAFGGPAPGPDAPDDAELGYWSARLIMQGRPLAMLISEVAGRYGLRISEKFAVQAVPFLGAASGALINRAFLDHYRNLARVHFTIRRLERLHGAVKVREEATEIARDLRLSGRA